MLWKLTAQRESPLLFKPHRQKYTVSHFIIQAQANLSYCILYSVMPIYLLYPFLYSK